MDLFRSNRTFKPKRSFICADGNQQSDLFRKLQCATLGSGNLCDAVRLPEGEDLHEWLAVNIVDFFKQINMLFLIINDIATPEKCPVMSAGSKYEYHWADGTQIKKPLKCSAPQYIDYLMCWVQDQLEDESIFPSKIGLSFPKNFESVAKTIMRRLFRIYAHIYYQHMQDIEALKEEAHLNTSFKHFILFVREFRLIENRELQPLQEIIRKLTTSKMEIGNNT